ncbi:MULTISPECIES: hypothetical protein [unclassified Vibrio]|uniref:hypothetical protein n=1 Tax=unclassified Vibrio TaxID=2614977 RepID=UPI001361CB10|nr:MULTISPECIES: hypothetical protein [unclassified Vibrio]NAW56080.1 hypothetical protein [Vibrio sp. V36_P2S2PM302]NAX27994.1 hypothetical protein [Vibrio sp. V38_P2S17PM301]NAX29010.1 hypothetical protein [Vibrio sp. V37_P2S8PM304]
MIQSLLTLFAPMLLGAQLVLTLVLTKGDICPGQRGRIHKLLPALAILWLAIASIQIQAFLVVFALFYFYSQVQTKKTRERGPMWVMYLADGLAAGFVGAQIAGQATGAGMLAMLTMVLLLGGAFAHLLLTVARTRLQAFHRILPFSGVVAAMLIALIVLLHAYSLDEQALAVATQQILVGFAVMLTAIIVWCWHIFTSKTVNKVQLAVALVCVIGSAYINSGLFHL